MKRLEKLVLSGTRLRQVEAGVNPTRTLQGCGLRHSHAKHFKVPLAHKKLFRNIAMTVARLALLLYTARHHPVLELASPTSVCQSCHDRRERAPPLGQQTRWIDRMSSLPTHRYRIYALSRCHRNFQGQTPQALRPHHTHLPKRTAVC